MSDLAPEALQRLTVIHDQCARALQLVLSAYLREPVAITVEHVRQAVFPDTVTPAAAASCYYGVEVQPSGAAGFVRVDRSLVFPMLEYLLGGRPSTPASPERPLTELETLVFENIWKLIVRELDGAWQAAAPGIRIFGTGALSNTESLEGRRNVIETKLRVEFGMWSECGVVILPLHALKDAIPASHGPAPARGSAGPAVNPSLYRVVAKSDVDISICFEGLTLSASDLMDLKPGDILALDCPISTPLRIAINGLALYEGRPAAGRSGIAVSIDRPIDHDWRGESEEDHRNE